MGVTVAARTLVLVALGLAVAAAALSSGPSPVCPTSIDSYISSQLVDTGGITGRSTWAIRVAALGSPTFLVDWNGARVFPPASNTKLLTYATVLSTMNISSSFVTTFWAEPAASMPALSGLCVEPGGDPSLSTADLAAAAAAIAAAGVTSVATLTVDISLFTPATIAPASWELEDFAAAYGAQANSAMVNENAVVVTLTAGSDAPRSFSNSMPTQRGSAPAPMAVTVSYAVAADAATMPVDVTAVSVSPGAALSISGSYVPGSPVMFLTGTMPPGSSVVINGLAGLNPNQRFADELAAALAAVNVTVGATALALTPCACAAVPTPAVCAPPLARISSPPLVELIQAALLESDNTATEVFLRHVGARAVGSAGGDVVAAGLAVVASTLAQFGIEPGTFSQVDGSGDSRQNLIAPDLLVALLQAMAMRPVELASGQSVVLGDLLPVGAVSGTIADRFIGTLGAGRVIAKTGSLDNVNALSGYINRTGLGAIGLPTDTLVFSIVNTGSMVNSTEGRDQLDSLVLELFALRTDCARPSPPSPAHRSPSTYTATLTALCLLSAVVGASIGALLVLAVVRSKGQPYTAIS